MNEAMTIRVVPPAESDRLLDRQSRARMYIAACPFRSALNIRWRKFYKDRAREAQKIFEIQSRN